MARALPASGPLHLQDIERDNVREILEAWNRNTFGKLQYKLERYGKLTPFEQELKGDCERALHWYSKGYVAGDAVEIEPLEAGPPLPVLPPPRQLADERETEMRYWVDRMERQRAEEAAKPLPPQTELLPRDPWDIPREKGKGKRKGKRSHGAN